MGFLDSHMMKHDNQNKSKMLEDERHSIDDDSMPSDKEIEDLFSKGKYR